MILILIFKIFSHKKSSRIRLAKTIAAEMRIMKLEGKDRMPQETRNRIREKCRGKFLIIDTVRNYKQTLIRAIEWAKT